MKTTMLKRLLVATALFFAASASANAVTCFWVGGTGNWTDPTHWSSGTGGSGSTCGGSGTGGIPGALDSATLDGLSGGGTVTMDATVSITSITMDTFTGTLNDGGHTVNMSGVFSSNGTSTRTLTKSGAWFMTRGGSLAWIATITTNMTLNDTGSLTFGTASRTSGYTLNLGSTNLTYNTITILGGPSPALDYGNGINVGASTTVTINTLNIAAPQSISFPTSSSRVIAITNPINFTGGSASTPIYVTSQSDVPAVISTSATTTAQWVFLRAMSFTGGTQTFTNSFDMGLNSTSGTFTITPPSASSGGGFIIGGG